MPSLSIGKNVLKSDCFLLTSNLLVAFIFLARETTSIKVAVSIKLLNDFEERKKVIETSITEPISNLIDYNGLEMSCCYMNFRLINELTWYK